MRAKLKNNFNTRIHLCDVWFDTYFKLIISTINRQILISKVALDK